MIAFLQGEVKHLEYTKVVVLTQSGVGYEVLINENIYSEIVSQTMIELHIYHHRTENFQFLFWFVHIEEKELFEELIKINWIGGKVALNILSIWLERLVLAVKNSDNKTIEWIKWIGKKWASKIILELKDADFVKHYESNNTHSDTSSWDNNSINSSSTNREVHEKVITTLVAMWYNVSDIEKTLANLPESHSTVEEIIPYVIRSM